MNAPFAARTMPAPATTAARPASATPPAIRTMWSWLIGPFVLAHLRVHQDPAAAAQFLVPFADPLRMHGSGSVSEISDGDSPFTPRGCIAQAWSVAEILRAWLACRNLS